MIKSKMKNYNTILIEQHQNDQHYHQVKHEYLTGAEILPSDQSRIIEQAKFTYSSLGRAFEKQIKTIEDQGKVEVLKALKPKNQELESIKGFFPKKVINNEIKNEIDKNSKRNMIFNNMKWQDNLI